MKKLNFLLALILIGAVCFSCKKTEQEPNINSTDRTDIQKPALDVEKVNQRINARLASFRVYQEQLAQSGNSNRDCMQTVVVPDDVSSIQDAIEMVCAYGEVIVKSGTYAESIMIFNKRGIHIRAVGNVIINGDFFIAFGANNTILEGFQIVLPDYPIYWDAVFLYYVSGCVIKNNIISNQAYPGLESEDYGITLWESANDNQIKDNEISEMFCGIDMGNFMPDQTCTNNMIMGNLISNVDYSIWVLGNCDNNKVMGNQINNSIGSVTHGITLTGVNFAGGLFTENNQIKLNHVSNCDLDGISMTGAFDNMIGPNNTCNYNGRDGISLWPDTGNNHVINNEALYNTGFDIWNGGVNNKFKANTAVTTYGL